MKLKSFFVAMLIIASCAMLFAQNNYLTVSELMTEFNNLGLSQGQTATGTYTVRGYVTKWENGYPTYQNASFYIDDNANGSVTLLQCFRLIGSTQSDQRTLMVGDYVEVQNAQLMNYYGRAELKNGSFIIVADATPAQFMGRTTIANFLTQQDMKNIYELKGVVSNITDSTFGHFDLTDATGTIYIYGLLDTDSISRAFANRNIEAGDTLTLQGVYNTYQNTPEIKDAILVSHRKKLLPQPEFMGPVTIAEFLQIADPLNIYQLTGTVYSIYDYEKGVLLIADSTNQIEIDGVLTADSVANAFSTLDVAPDDTITINAVYSALHGNVENAVFISRTKYIAPQFECQIGDSVYWTVDFDTETITIYGKGDMWDTFYGSIIHETCSISTPIHTVIVEEGVTSIAQYAFSGDDIQTIILPGSLQRIGDMAFQNCSIMSVDIPENISFISRTAFWGCPLTEINVSNQNNTYCSEDGILFDKNKKTLYMYPRNKEGDTYHIPNSVECIYHTAFCGNTNLISVSMDNNVQSVGVSAFADCKNLIALTLSENLNFIGYNAVHGTALYYDSREWDNDMLYIGNNLIEINNYYGLNPEPNDPEPASIRSRSTEEDSIYVIKEGTRLIATDAASTLQNHRLYITKITIPSTMEFINPNGLCLPMLQEVVWNAKHCHDFEASVLVDKYPYGEIDSLVIYNPFCGYRYSADHSYGKSYVTKISFGKDVEYLPTGICSVMPYLENVYNYNPEPIVIAENTFENVPSTCILYVPKGSKAKYENAPVWQNFYRIREMDGSAIDEITTDSNQLPQKIYRNGQVLILRDGKVYTTTGQEVE